MKPVVGGREDALRELARRLSYVPGDIVECGVWNGASLAAITTGLPDRHVWAYDSFEGMPPIGPHDPPEAAEYVGRVVGSEAALRELLAGRRITELTVRAGWFKDTFKEEPLPERIAFLSIDCDWYSSVFDSLTTLYELVAPGGVVVLDDWGCWEGCRLAFYDWAEMTGEHPLLLTFGLGQAYWVKGQEHVRNT